MKYYLLAVFLLMLHITNAQTKSKKDAIEQQINQAGVLFNQGQYEKALQLSRSALIKSYKAEDDYLIAHSYNAIGVIYDEFSESKRAIEFYNKALLYASNIQNDSLNDWIYSNLGSTYYFNKIDVNKGINYYKKSLKFAAKIKDTIQVTYGKLNIASAYFSKGDFQKGILYIQEVEPYVLQNGQPEMQFTLAALLGDYHSSINQNQQAEEYYFKAIAIAQKNKLDSYLVNVYENLSIHYKENNKLDLSKAYFDKSEFLSKKIYSENDKQELEKSAIQIELDENKIQLERIESQYKLQHKKLEESNLAAILFGILFIILLLFVYTLYKSNSFRKKANEALLQSNLDLSIAKEKAEEASQLKSQFVSTITHELRTPLYGVVGITDMISEEHPELANSSHLNSLKFSASYLLSLVNDILQINKIEEKRIVLELLEFNIQNEINIVLNSVQFIAQNNNNVITTEIDPTIPKILIGDKLRLSQIVMNLLSNALKFTKNGAVVISANQTKVVEDKHFIEFKITDTGVGIDLNDHDKVFDKFVQVGRKVEDYQGTGLGLTIVKRLVELFGSEIYLESKLNEGTTFTFTIGFATGLEQNINDENYHLIQVTDLDLYRILVVEDNKINQMVTQKILSKNNCSCDIANDGYEALHLLEENTYDVILMDINMPVLDGYETTRKIRNLGIATPIIALTAFDRDEIVELAFNSGMNDILIKPFEPVKLFQLIKIQIQKSKNTV